MTLIGCKENKKEMKAFTKLEDARNYITESFLEKEETLMISDEINDAMGMNMAIITDEILKKGYMPNGFEQKDGYRVYKYQKD
ncbi:hypothetical protein AUTU_27630 [Aureibacter tunicatorum]|nr:hypothetical protein AUTU_27630 [Aureibacter tunicatorum]